MQPVTLSSNARLYNTKVNSRWRISACALRRMHQRRRQNGSKFTVAANRHLTRQKDSQLKPPKLLSQLKGPRSQSGRQRSILRLLWCPLIR